jgi:CHASE2 domain-containing sensor protein
MLDTLIFIVGLLGIVSTWRFLICAGLSFAIGLGVSWVLGVSGSADALQTAACITLLGCGIGVAWQLRYERASKRQRSR